MPKPAYLGNAGSRCGRYCRNVCSRLFVVGRGQCISDCLSCARNLNKSQSKGKSKRNAHVKKHKRSCGCGCGKCK